MSEGAPGSQQPLRGAPQGLFVRWKIYMYIYVYFPLNHETPKNTYIVTCHCICYLLAAKLNVEAGVNLYIKNLDETTDDDSLKELFDEFGTITSVAAMKASRERKEFSKGCFIAIRGY